MDDNSTEGSASVRPEAPVESSHSRKRGMVLPFEPHSLTFDGITYSVDMPQVTKFYTETVQFGPEKQIIISLISPIKQKEHPILIFQNAGNEESGCS